MGLLKLKLRPEFLNRIDETIMFTPLTKEDLKDIVHIQIKDLSSVLKKRNISLEANAEAIDHIAELGYDPQFGARPIKRIVQKNVLNALSKELLSGNIKDGDALVLDVFDGKFVFRKPIESETKNHNHPSESEMV